MKNYKKTLFGSILTLIIGTSCCWLSSLAIWFGGVAVVGTVASFMESTQSLFILISVALAIVSIFLYNRYTTSKKLTKSTRVFL